jgi:hypothetical protein
MLSQSVSRNWSFAIASIFLISTCSCRSAAETLSQELSEIASWAAAVHKAGEKWMAGDVPTHYAAHTFRVAEQALEDESGNLQSLQMTDDIRARVLENLLNIKNITHSMQDAVRQGDRIELGKAIENLATEEQAIAFLMNGN